MLRFYLLSMWDASKLTAAGALLVLVVITAMSRLGLEPAMMSMMLWPVAFMGYMLLAQRYVGRNLHWILGLPFRKLTLAWFNFGLNLSLLVVVNIGCGAVVLATYVLFPNEAIRKGAHDLSQIAHDVGYAHLLSFLHGRTLAVVTFAVTLVLFLCWSVTRWPDAQEMVRARQSMGRRLLIVVPLVIFGQTFLITSLHKSNAMSPLLIFAAVTSLLCLFVPYGTGKNLGTSIRQRRAWMLTGGTIAALEVVAMAAMAASDLGSGELLVRVEAAKFLGPLGGERAARELEAAASASPAPMAGGQCRPREGALATAGAESAPPGTRIELERWGGMGARWCKVALNDLGEVTFTGLQSSYSGTASRRAIADLVTSMRTHGLWSLKDHYDCGVSDTPGVLLHVALLGYMKSVDRSLGCTTDLAPDWLVQIEDRIDEVAQAEQWRQSAGCYHPRESGRSAP